jgi:predicted Zn-dependent peptidase
MLKISLRMLILILPIAIGCARAGCGKAPGGQELLERVEEYRLPNGMMWLLAQRGTAPVFTGLVQVRVGGIEEEPGKAGLAHMFEHMAFKGSREIGVKDPVAEAQVLEKLLALEQEDAALPPGDVSAATRKALEAKRESLVKDAKAFVVPNEVWQLFHSHGAAEVNAFTSKDVTAFYARMPSERLRLWVYLTSHMVLAPMMREFYAERNVVTEERRSSVDNSPRGRLYEALMRTAFTTSPYRIMTIGALEEIQALTMTDAMAFHQRYYRPDRMVGVLVGNFDPVEAKAAILEWFGSAPATPSVETPQSSEPQQVAERRVEVTFDAAPRLMIAYHKPKLPHHDDFVFDAIQYVLCASGSGRLVKRIERELQIARRVGCWSGSPGSRRDNLFIVTAEPLGSHSIDDVIAAIEAELTQFRAELITPKELAKAQQNLIADALWGLNSNESLARQLAYFQTIAGDWRYLVTHGERMAKITVGDVRKTAAAYLNPHQRTIATLRRPE